MSETLDACEPQRVQAEGELGNIRLHSVARVFKIIGWFGVALYGPITATCVGCLYLTLLGYRTDPPFIVAGASVFNGAILGLGMAYVRTGRQISRRDLSARRRAILLSTFMMIGFPLFTIVGVICYRNIKRYFNDEFLLSESVEQT